MPRTSPESAFAEAQDAIAREDWEGFFACLHRDDLLKIAANSVNALVNPSASPSSELSAVAERHGFSVEVIQKLLEIAREITASAQTVLGPSVPGASAYDPARHRQLVTAYNNTLKQGLKSVPDLARLTAGLERQMRTLRGGGSVSSTMFVGEVLEDVVIDGKGAWAIRRSGTWTEDLGFVQKKGEWFIRLFARRPSRRE